MHGDLEAVAGVARIELAGQRTLGHQPQRIGTPLRNRRLVAVRARRGRRHLLQRRLHRAQQHRAHLRGQPRAQQQHAGLVHLRAQHAAGQAYLLAIRLRGLVCLPPAAYQPLHLRGGGAAGHRQQPRLGGRGSHPRQGPDLRIGEPAAGHGRGDVGQLGQRGGHAQLLAGGAEVEAGAPVEPVGAGAEALPAVLLVELVQVTQQLVDGGVDARRQLGDAVTEAVQVGWLGSFPQRRCRCRRVALMRRPVSGLSGDARARGLRGERRLACKDGRVEFHDHQSYTRISAAP